MPVLLVTATGREAEAAAAAIGDLIGDDNVALFPSWETLPHERLSPRADTVGRRLATLRRIAHPEQHPAGYPAVVVATVRSMIQPMAPHLGEMAPVTLRVGEEVDLTELVEQLVSLAYTRVDMVEKRGEIAVRGGILDIFPPTVDHPVRVEFLGDEITDLRDLRGHRPAVAGRGRGGGRAAVPGDPADRRGAGAGRARCRPSTPATRRWRRCWTTWPTGSASRAWSR